MFSKNYIHCLKKQGYIKTIREDGKIDKHMLQKQGYENNHDEFQKKFFRN